MKPEWYEFLKHAGAEIKNNRVISFGNIERERRILQTGLVICDLSHHGLISADGEDAESFLQGQLTNDAREVSSGQNSQLTAYCTHKGRMLANFRLFRRNDSYFMSLPQSLLEGTLKRISMFILMAKVTLKDSSSALIKIGFSGPTADEHLNTILANIPSQANEMTCVNGYTIIKGPGTLPRYEIYGELDDMQSLWNQLDVNAAPAGAHVWETLNIHAGIPTITPKTSGAFVPHMTNMQLINGVNFQKGCYTGQEVVARMQYLGKLKRQMFHVIIETKEPVSAGDKLYSEGSKSGQGTGQIVNAEVNANGSVSALAVIDITDAHAGKLQLNDENGPAITLQSLPYSLEDKPN